MAGQHHGHSGLGESFIDPVELEQIRAEARSEFVVSTPGDGDGRWLVAYHLVSDYPLMVSPAVNEEDALIPWRRVALPIAVGVFLVIAFILMTTALVVLSLLRKESLEAALKESDTKLRYMVQSVRDAILTVDPSKRVILFNAAAEKMFGLEANEVLGKQIDEALFQCQPRPLVLNFMHYLNEGWQSHRTAAALFVGIFLIHFVYVMQRLLRDKTFRWFGPDSLIPNWKDFADCWGMFKWFFGQGPKPQFERWAYFEKFDYWAVFWGVNIIGWCGLMLAFPHVTATYLPGWVFNVATLVHGEEAFLAAVFLFTVHFFNNHFRPDKLPPPDVVMFTGTQSIEEFRKDHPAHYQRMVETGELEKYLVDAPSKQMHIGSVILGIVLITVGLGLLVLVAMGFFGK